MVIKKILIIVCALLLVSGCDKQTTKGGVVTREILNVEEKWKPIELGVDRDIMEGSAMFRHNNKIYLVGFGGSDNNKEMLTYDYVNKEWGKKKEYPYGLEMASFVKYKNNFYVFGGNNNTCIHTASYKYNIIEDRWIPIKPLPYPLVCSTSALIDGKVHMVGGSTKVSGLIGSTDKHLVYDIEKDEYYYETPFPYPIQCSSFGVVDNKIYILGGHNVQSFGDVGDKIYLGEHNIQFSLKTQEKLSNKIFSYSENTWEEVALLPQTITLANRNSVVYKNKIFTFGGRNRENNRVDFVYAYDTKKNIIEKYPQLPMAVENTNIILIDNNVFLFGGFCYYRHCFEDRYILNLHHVENLKKLRDTLCF